MEVQAIDVMPEDRQNGISNALAVPEIPLNQELPNHGRTIRLNISNFCGADIYRKKN